MLVDLPAYLEVIGEGICSAVDSLIADMLMIIIGNSPINVIRLLILELFSLFKEIP